MSDCESEGRKPPPEHSRFKPGRTGNVSGRPKGAVSRRKLTAKVAQGKHSVKIGGRLERRTMLDLVVRKLREKALKGEPAAIAEWLALNRELRPEHETGRQGFLVVSPVLSQEAWIARAMRFNARVEEMNTLREWEAAQIIRFNGGRRQQKGPSLRWPRRKLNVFKGERLAGAIDQPVEQASADRGVGKGNARPEVETGCGRDDH